MAELATERIAILYNLLPSGINYDKDPVQTSPKDALTEIMAKVDDIDRQIQNYQESYLEASARVNALINLLSDVNDRRVMKLWYVGCMCADDIADYMGYTRDWVYKHHRLCIDALEKIIQDYTEL